jgi:hypothetical protein
VLGQHLALQLLQASRSASLLLPLLLLLGRIQRRRRLQLK